MSGSSEFERRLASLGPAQRALLERRLREQRSASAPAAAIARQPAGAEPRLTFAQERFWFLEQLDPGALELSLTGIGRLRGPVEPERLTRALARVVAAHEALHCRIENDAGRPRLQFDPEAPVALRFETAPSLDAPGRVEHALERARVLSRTPFELARGPLLRAECVQFDAQDHALVLSLHHAVADGWSLALLLRELRENYAGTTRTPAPSLRLRDFAAWERERLTPERRAAELAAWRGHLAGFHARPALPLDRPRPPRLDARGERTRHAIDPTALAAVRKLAAEARTSEFVVLLAAFGVFLGRALRCERFTLGTSNAARDALELASLVGPLVRTVAVPFELKEAEGLLAHVQRTARHLAFASEHYALPFEQLVDGLELPRDPAHTPLFDVFFDKAPDRRVELRGEVATGEIEFDPGRTQFDLALGLASDARGTQLVVDRRTALFDEATVEGLLDGYSALLTAVAAEPARPVRDAPLIGERQRTWQLDAGRGPAVARSARLVPDWLRQRTAEAPQAPAIEGPEGTLSRAEFQARAEGLAGRIARAGLGPGARVAVLAGRDVETLLAAHACWILGLAYVPIDPCDPEARTRAILADTAPALALGTARHLDRVQSLGIDALPLDARHLAPGELSGAETARAEHPAFAIFSSGSTGRPKGSLIGHAALANHTAATLERFGFAAEDRFLLRTPTTFDSSIWELVQPVAAGAVLVVPEQAQQRDLMGLIALIAERRVSVVQVVPSLLSSWIDALGRTATPALRHVVCSGEVLPASLAQRFIEACSGTRLHNVYGPSEACIDTCWHAIDAAQPALGAARASVPIGRPLPGVELRLVDPSGALVPNGCAGELWVAGAGLALSELPVPSSPSARFPKDERFAGGRVYATGDLARWLPDRRLEFLGRADGQVQLFGRRVELGEIERAVAASAGIVAAAARVRGSGAAARLEALIVLASGAQFDADGLREELHERLPAALIPSRFLPVDALPLGPTEKLDRGAVDALEVTGAPAPIHRDPADALEAALAAEFAAVLGEQRVDCDRDFFRAGGNSLLAVRLVARIEQQLDRELPLRWLFEAPTVAELANRLRRGTTRAAVRSSTPAPEATGPVRATSAQEQIWIHEQLDPGSGRFHVPALFELEGEVEVGELRAAVQRLVERHDALRLRIVEREGLPWLEFPAQAPIDVRSGDLPAGDGERPPRELLEELSARFDLEHGPLLRVRLWNQGARQLLLLHQHHAITDATSVHLLLEELLELLAAGRAGRVPELAELPTTFEQVARRAQGPRTDRAPDELLDRRAEELDGVSGVLELPFDRPRGSRPSRRLGVLTRALPTDLPERVRALARARGATVFGVLLASYTGFLMRVAGASRAVVGTTDLGRDRSELEPLVGLFVRVLPLHVDLSGNPRFDELVVRVHRSAGRAFDARELPLELLLERCPVPRHPARHPLYQTAFELIPAPPDRLQRGPFSARDAQSRDVHLEGLAPKLDFGLTVEDRGQRFVARVDYDAELFDEATAGRLFDAWQQLLVQALDAPQTRIGDLVLPAGTPVCDRGAAAARSTDPAGAAPAVHGPAEAAPREAELLELAQGLLGAPELQASDDLIAAGARSLTLIQLALLAERELGLDLPAARLFARPSVRGALAPDPQVDRPRSRAKFLREHAQLDPDIRPLRRAAPGTTADPAVLLTGATGFLGAHLIPALLDAGAARVVALVRAADERSGRQRLEGVLARYGIDPAPLRDRLTIICGDLADPRLGEQLLASNSGADRVVHSGAEVDFFAGYEQLAPANVAGTTELLRFACAAGGLPLHFVSTTGIFDSPSVDSAVEVNETTPLDGYADLELGYEQTKWVAEALVRQAAERGLPVCVHRPGRIAAHSDSSAWSGGDLLVRAIRGCLALGAVPEIDARVDLTPVDYVAQAIAAVALRSRELPDATHLVHPDPPQFSDLTALRGPAGEQLESLDYGEWLERALAAVHADPEHPLLALVPLLRRGAQADPGDFLQDLHLPRIGCARTLEHLRDLDVRPPPLERELFERWFRSLAESST